MLEELELDGGLLVGHDGSSASGEAVRWADAHAVRLGTRLHVMRAWVITTAPRPATAEFGYVSPLIDFETAVREALAADVAALDLTGAVEQHVIHGRSAKQLLAAGCGAELIVVGRRGEGGFRGLGFGSTADQVVRHATSPVVVVPVDSDDG